MYESDGIISVHFYDLRAYDFDLRLGNMYYVFELFEGLEIQMDSGYKVLKRISFLGEMIVYDFWAISYTMIFGRNHTL